MLIGVSALNYLSIIFLICIQTAVGLFNSEVKAHLLLFANRGTKEFTELKKNLRALAPDFTGKVRTKGTNKTVA